MVSGSAVAERQDHAPANVEQHPVASNSQALMLMAERLATNPSADVTKLQQILEIAREARREEAEAAFNEAMTAAQIEMGRVAANKDNKQTKSRYADYAQLDRALRPIYTKHGFALSFDTEDSAAGVKVVAHVSRAGFSRDYKIPMPTDGKGPQGGDVMTKTHATGAAMTYGMRYLLKMIFNVAIGEDDTDGNIPGAVIGDEQLGKLRALIDEVGGDVAKLCAHFKIGALPDLPVARFAEAVGIIELKRQRGGK